MTDKKATSAHAPKAAPTKASSGAYIPNHIYAPGDQAPADVINESNATGGTNLVDADAKLTVHGAEIATQRAATPVEVT